MNKASLYYLKEVLGIDTVAAPAVPHLVVLTAEPINKDERELIQKMLTAIKCSEAVFAVEKVENEMNFQFGLSFGVKESSNIYWLELPDIKRFFNLAAADELRTLKKETWAKLQQFETEMRLKLK